jgi:hypothetical protein
MNDPGHPAGLIALFPKGVKDVEMAGSAKRRDVDPLDRHARHDELVPGGRPEIKMCRPSCAPV